MMLEFSITLLMGIVLAFAIISVFAGMVMLLVSLLDAFDSIFN